VAHGASTAGVKLGIGVEDVPLWFVRLVAPPPEALPRSILPGEQADIVIVADPADEIREVWNDIRPLFLIAILGFVVICMLLYAVVTRGLRPLGNLIDAFERLGRNELSVRVVEDGSPELTRLSAQFNRTAAALETSVEQNRRLTAEMVDLQEEERRHLVRELHDDMAPCLFDIRVRVSAMANLVRAGSLDLLQPQLQAIEHSAEDLQSRVRTILRRLRPLALDELGLDGALLELVEAWRTRMSSIEWSLHIEEANDDLPDTIQVTAYRLVQEALTNVARHSGARHASVRVGSAPGRSRGDGRRDLVVAVEDDGHGIAPDETPGLGLRGVRERVQALGGEVDVARAGERGTRLRASIPIPPDAATDA
jgi:two-component system sensor histidine kinase UhpB